MNFFNKRTSALLLAAVVTLSSILPVSASAEAQSFTTVGSAADAVKHFLGGSSVTLVDGSESIKGPLENVSSFDELNAGTLPDGTALSLNKGLFLKAEAMGATGDDDLKAILDGANKGAEVTNVSALEFEFTVPEGKTSVALSFIFASQESIYDWDIAGVFVDGVNYAFMPNGSILRVNPAANLFNYPSPVVEGWRSWAPPQTLVGLLDSSKTTHKLKIAVANTGDDVAPTGIFISGLTPGNATTGGVQEPSKDASVSPVSGIFDQYMGTTEPGSYDDVSTVLTLNGNTFTDITLAGTSLDSSAYTVDEESITLHKEYLATLAAGEHQFTLVMDAGENPVFTVQIRNSAPPLLQSAVSGDGEVSLTWSPVDGSTGYKIYQSATSATYGDEVAAVSSAVYSHTITGLTNGAEYYFAVKAVNGGGDSLFSNQLNALPQMKAPDAPAIQSAVPGNGEVTLSWNGAETASGYSIYQSLTPDMEGTPAASVSGDVYSHTVTGLTNGTTYYFTVTAENAGGISPASGTVSAVPATTPDSPTEIAAVPGDREVTVHFMPPAVSGGQPVIGYSVTAEPGGITATGTGSPIVVTGLNNNTSYTFTVKAINLMGSSVSSQESAAVIPTLYVPTTAPTTAIIPETAQATEVLVNGEVINAGTLTTSNLDGQSLQRLTVDQQKLEEMIANQEQGAVVTLPISSSAQVTVVELNGQMIKNMENKGAVLQMKTPDASYSLPAGQIKIDNMSSQFGETLALEDIKIEISISTPNGDVVQQVNSAATRLGVELLGTPVDFTVRGVYDGKSAELTTFSGYVSRSITLPEGTDASKITTGIVVDPDGTIRQVPTKVSRDNERYVAEINSLTNSVYTVVYHPVAFADVAQHWAKDAVNDFGSRLIINGVGAGTFAPDQNITRAEFASILVNALGLKPASTVSSFNDVNASDWFGGAVETASAYGLLQGYEGGSFRPQELITREQAMTIVSKAMALTGLADSLGSHTANAVLGAYADASAVAPWAADGVAGGLQAGLINGRGNGAESLLAPKANMTRAEVAAMLQRLLQKSGLI
ncbi:S-layer homology domain-containing protein [Paenibacillus tengchongensis]|uniref:S-layer homology domain-containing protein n=1 Tax=Paenibacillus tengchongensis TaxID=2608684 RepID=UPI00124CEC49|nr:S-layer homology domain-containing protein [Paenibacillus tengchongensis]